MSEICKGVVLTTKKPCTKSVTANGLCGRHQEQLFLLQAKANGLIVCRQFDRGCRNYLLKEEIDSNLVTCKVCREKLSGKEKHCEQEGCTYKSEDTNRFCGKHSRNHYREIEASTEIRYCNIDRGCASVLKEGEKTCSICINNIKQNIKKQIDSLRDVETKCLKCKESEKSIGHFCDACISTITFVDSVSRRDINDIWHDIYKGAIDRNNLILLPYTTFSQTIILPCFYCGEFANNGFHGIDRYDNTKGYIVSNIKPCCSRCNIMKNDMHVQAFIDKVKIILKYTNDNLPIPSELVEKWRQCYTTKEKSTFTTYKNNVINSRKISFHLTEEEYISFLNNPCYLCGIVSSEYHKNGIDRIDSDLGYTMENCKTCCTHCNLMKNSTNLPEFLKHCLRISKYYKTNEENVIYNSVPRFNKHKELYRSSDIYEFIQKNTIEHFCSWAKEACKTSQFIQGIRDIYDKKHEEKEETIKKIQRQMEMERTRTCKERDESHDTKHYSAKTVHAMLSNGKSEEFKDWYEKKFGASESFQEQFETLIGSIVAIPTKDGIELCRKFMKAETNRRKSIMKSNVKREMKVPEKRKAWVAKDLPKIQQNIIEYTNKNVIEHIALVEKKPKQWKSIDIYNCIKNKKGIEYKKHCEGNNEMNDIWENKWKTFADTVFGALSFDSIKDYIQSFIVELRCNRHKKLIEKSKANIIEREDRLVWPKETVLKAFVEGKINKFKEFNIVNGETGEVWERRWSKLITDLERTLGESERLEIIRKFQVNVRIARYRAK